MPSTVSPIRVGGVIDRVGGVIDRVGGVIDWVAGSPGSATGLSGSVSTESLTRQPVVERAIRETTSAMCFMCGEVSKDWTDLSRVGNPAK